MKKQKTWARAVAGMIRKDGRETICEDKIKELEFLVGNSTRGG